MSKLRRASGASFDLIEVLLVVNWASSDRITSRTLPKEMRVFIKSSFFDELRFKPKLEM